ncbi:MAG: alpha/beta hydrolase-fold protein [Gemmataceae bacterium]
MVRDLAIVLASALFVGCARPSTGFLCKSFKAVDGVRVNYTVFVPHDYRPDRPVPAVLFLHGAGETGTDGRRPSEVGLGPAIKKREATFPFLVVFPQIQAGPTFASWQPGQPDGDRAIELFDAVSRDYAVDPDRQYLVGMSIGGFGVWSQAVHDPWRWAAIVPICGIAPSARAERLVNVPCWCFHGGRDGNVEVEHSRRMVAELRRLGSSPRYTEFAEVGHDSWTPAFATDELYDWLLRQRRRSP